VFSNASPREAERQATSQNIDAHCEKRLTDRMTKVRGPPSRLIVRLYSFLTILSAFLRPF
jgi:hypothetical protein